MKLSVVIPAYNEAENIRATIDEALKSIHGIPEITDYGVIVVDDHSSDGTFDVVRGTGDKRVSCLRLSRRSGSHTALRAGLAAADGDAVLCISADGQDAPSCLPAMVEKWRNGAMVVWALRKSREDETRAYRSLALAFYWTLKKVNEIESDVDLSRADFYMVDRSVVDAVNSCPERNTSLFGLIAWLGFESGSVEYDRRARRRGSSKWTFRSRVRLAKDWVVAFSGLPLKLTTYLGLAVASAGFLYALFIIGNALFGNPVVGWSSTMVVVLILGGVQLIALGIIGEYLWRNIDESRRRPLYFVEKRTGK